MKITLGEKPHPSRKGTIVLFYSVFILEIIFPYPEMHAQIISLVMHLCKPTFLAELKVVRLLWSGCCDILCFQPYLGWLLLPELRGVFLGPPDNLVRGCVMQMLSQKLGGESLGANSWGTSKS